MSHIEKNKLLQFLEKRINQTDNDEVKMEILHIAMMAKVGTFDIRIWED